MKRVTTVMRVAEADSICGGLKMNGIPSFASNLNTVSMVPYLSSCLGGIDIFVHEKDYARAKEIITRMNPPPPKRGKSKLHLSFLLAVFLLKAKTKAIITKMKMGRLK